MKLRNDGCACHPCDEEASGGLPTVIMKNTIGNIGGIGEPARPFMLQVVTGSIISGHLFPNPWGYDYTSPVPQQGPKLIAGRIGYLLEETTGDFNQHLIVSNGTTGDVVIDYRNETPQDLIRGIFSDGVDWFLLMVVDGLTDDTFASWYVRKVNGETAEVIGDSDLFHTRMQGNPDLGEPLTPRGGANHWMTATMLSDGRLAVGGDYWFVGLVERPRIAVLNNDLTLDAGFNAEFDSTYISASTWQGPDGPYSILEYGGALYLWILTTREFVTSFPCTTFFGGVARRGFAQVDMVTGALGSFQPFSSGWSGSTSGPYDDGPHRTFPKGEPPYELKLRMEPTGILVTATATAADDELASSGHGLTDGQRVRLSADGSNPMPGGLAAGAYYFVRDSTTNTFKAALTSGGAAVNITTNGTCQWEQAVPWVWLQGGSYLGGVLATSYFTRINLEDGSLGSVTLPAGFFTGTPPGPWTPFSFEFHGDDLVMGLDTLGGGGYNVVGNRPCVTKISLTSPGFTDTTWGGVVEIGGPGRLGQIITAT